MSPPEHLNTQTPEHINGLSVAVYCASSNRIDGAYVAVAEQLGKLLAERGHTLVYGGGDVGLMGRLARAVHDTGGHVIGVIPEALKLLEGVAYGLSDELIVTQTMRERKGIIFKRSEAFIALPGGLGTLEELLEVLTLKQLRYHTFPIVILNTNGFFNGLLAFFDHLIAQHFARPATHKLYHVASTPEDALAHIEAYEPTPVPDKRY